jgi:hypothetical protein
VLILGCAATAAFGAVVGVIPEVERDPDDVITSVPEARGRDGRVDPAAHGHEDPLSKRHRSTV